MGKKVAIGSAADAVELELLTPLCELTMVIAQAGQRLTPPLTIPPSLKPFLRFTHKLPMPGLRAVRRVIDSEPDWRARVASAATEALIGEAGMIYVNRPDGWRELFERLVGERRDLVDSDGHEKTLRQLERRLSVSEDRVRVLTAELAQTRRDAQERVADARVDGVAATAALRQERERRIAGEREVNATISALQTTQKNIDALRRENDELREHVALASSEIAALTSRVGELAARPATHQQSLDVASFLDALSDSLKHAQAEIAQFKQTMTIIVPTRSPSKGPTPSKEKRLAQQRERNPSIREPMVLPGGLAAESTDAALQLVKVRNAVVLVDGYNLAKTWWPKTAGGASVLRERLISTLDGIASRTRRPFTVVFDGTSTGSESSGARVAASPSRLTSPSQVTVLFSPATKEADVVITEILAAIPASRPVIVVSSDRRVQRLVESMGANVISSQQFVEAFR